MKTKRLFAMLMVCAMLLALAPCAFADADVKTATASAEGFEETVTVTVTMTDGVITEVVAESDKADGLGQEALAKMPPMMVEQNTTEVDEISGCTGTSAAIIVAAREAVAQLAPGSDAWALANGYVKASDYNLVTGVDAVASATDAKMGGVNYGAIEWTEELQMTAVREFLKGGKFLGDPSCAQDESGYNYREMYQMATSFNNVPNNTNLELVLRAEDLHLVGVSEAGTSKTLEFMRNPNVSVSWVRQIRIPEEELGYTYYCSYGVQINGTVRVFTLDDFETTEGQDAILSVFDTYYPTMATTWMGYSMAFAEAADEAAVREAKLAYAKSTIERGASIVYEIVPTRIVITAPFLMNMIPQMANGLTFTTVHEDEDKYAYELLLSDSFIDQLIAYKAEVLSTEEGQAAVNEYYTSGPMAMMFQMLDPMCAQFGLPTSLEAALDLNCAAGLKTQTTYVPAE